MLRQAWLFGALVCLVACGSSAKTGTSTGATTTTTAVKPGVAATTTIEGEPTTTSVTARTIDFNMHAKGSINGVDFDGPIAATELRCTPSGAGDYVQVVWAGTIVVKTRGEQISGDMNLKIGSTVFPSGGTASLVLGGDYQHRVGATSGTATAGAKSGTINAEYAAGADHGAVQGTWRCT